MNKELKKTIIEKVKSLKELNDCVGVEIGDNQGLFIQVENYDGKKVYLLELNDIDEDSGWYPLATNMSEFGNMQELIKKIKAVI